MALIQPFKGLRYNHSKIDNLGEVITPPYDVISPADQEHLHQKNPYNIIRLEYGKRLPSDNEKENRYSRAESFLNQWLADKLLEADQEPCYYLYEQNFTHSSKKYCRRGIIAALRVEEYSNKFILPHELTMSVPKADRMELLKRLETNISPIFTLFPDPDQRLDHYFNAVSKKDCILEAQEDSGQYHRLWSLNNIALQEELTAYLTPQPLLIADGHHRYETALNYSLNNRDQVSSGKDFVLATLVSMKDPGLLVLPTHRLVDDLAEAQEIMLNEIISRHFDYCEYGILKDIDSEVYLNNLSFLNHDSSVIGIITKGKAGFLTPKNYQYKAALPVALLHEQILKPVLAPGEKSEVDKNVLSYPHDIDTAIQAIISGQSRLAFILEPIAVEEVLRRAEKGEIMPQKSTFFYPKLPSGLVLHHHKLSY